MQHGGVKRKESCFRCFSLSSCVTFQSRRHDAGEREDDSANNTVLYVHAAIGQQGIQGCLAVRSAFDRHQ